VQQRRPFAALFGDWTAQISRAVSVTQSPSERRVEPPSFERPPLSYDQLSLREIFALYRSMFVRCCGSALSRVNLSESIHSEFSMVADGPFELENRLALDSEAVLSRFRAQAPTEI